MSGGLVLMLFGILVTTMILVGGAFRQRQDAALLLEHEGPALDVPSLQQLRAAEAHRERLRGHIDQVCVLRMPAQEHHGGVHHAGGLGKSAWSSEDVLIYEVFLVDEYGATHDMYRGGDPAYASEIAKWLAEGLDAALEDRS